MKYLSHYMESAHDKALSTNGAFYAFGEDQLKEKSKEGVIYVHIGHGLICPKDNVSNLINELEKAFDNAIESDLKENGAYAIMQREYFNYESQIAGTEGAYNAMIPYQKRFPDIFTDEAIKKTFRESYELAIIKDMF